MNYQCIKYLNPNIKLFTCTCTATVRSSMTHRLFGSCFTQSVDPYVTGDLKNYHIGFRFILYGYEVQSKMDGFNTANTVLK